MEYIACLGKNKARQYRKLGRSLEEWQEIEDRALRLARDAAKLSSSNFPANALVLAIRSQKAYIANRTILLGFELDLYSVMDLPSVYWQLGRAARLLHDSLEQLAPHTTYTSHRRAEAGTLAELASATLSLLVS